MTTTRHEMKQACRAAPPFVCQKRNTREPAHVVIIDTRERAASEWATQPASGSHTHKKNHVVVGGTLERRKPLAVPPLLDEPVLSRSPTLFATHAR